MVSVGEGMHMCVDGRTCEREALAQQLDPTLLRGLPRRSS